MVWLGQAEFGEKAGGEAFGVVLPRMYDDLIEAGGTQGTACAPRFDKLGASADDGDDFHDVVGVRIGSE